MNGQSKTKRVVSLPSQDAGAHRPTTAGRSRAATTKPKIYPNNMYRHLTTLLSSLFSRSGNNGRTDASADSEIGEPMEMSENSVGHADQSSISSDETTSIEDHLISLPYTLKAWKLLKRNDPSKTICNLNGCDFLPSSAWKEMGETLARNTCVQELYVENCQLNEDNFTALMTELKENQSIRTLNFQNNPALAQGMSMTKLSTLLQTRYWTNNLVALTLCRTNLCDIQLRALLPSLNGTKIRQLFLNNNRLGSATNRLRVKENLSYAFDKLDMPELEELHLVGNELGREGCEALQYLLRNNNVRLKHLSLFRNHFDDGCCRLLAEGLKKSSLETMYIGSNGADEREYITYKGWEHILGVVCDDSSIQRTYSSNHVIHDFGDVDSNRVRPALAASSYIPLVLHEILKINASSDTPARKGRRKVAIVHFNLLQMDEIEEINLKLLQMDEIKLMPYVLEFVGKEGSLQALHHLIQNRPALFDHHNVS
ncbi:hypothetical protein ACHAWT_004861 [Skeletonema menzelii]